MLVRINVDLEWMGSSITFVDASKRVYIYGIGRD